jgi:hypothetical protein
MLLRANERIFRLLSPGSGLIFSRLFVDSDSCLERLIEIEIEREGE